ncbi:hypothetical protein DPMN_017354 [Dreissena polymorpha]|uniref:Uncharacterized protein n=1 Tax=Dreissena polymorpha TaxID=45954 RepID=A0A9D4NEJ2_DREPO|nr:hypothetical protein DPMN_017354 [Dreissena polymorpha]
MFSPFFGPSLSLPAPPFPVRDSLPASGTGHDNWAPVKEHGKKYSTLKWGLRECTKQYATFKWGLKG